MTEKPKVAPKRNVDPEIRAEITAQLIAMKTQLNKEIVADLTSLQQSMREEFSTDNNLAARIQKLAQENAALKIEVQQLRARVETIDKNVKTAASAATVQSNNQLALVKQSTGELMKVAAMQIEKSVYTKIVREIDTKIVPKITNMVDYVNFSMQDGAELINDFRREVEHNAVNLHAITDGKKDKRIISPHVRTFFGDDSDTD